MGRGEIDRGISDADTRERIIRCLNRNFLVEASAGTGKTTCLVERMISLVRTGTCGDLSALVGMTFTRKAAEELKIRFREELALAHRDTADPAERQRLGRALESIDRCFLGTIHSFCAQLLRERPVEAGIDPGFTEMDELEEAVLRKWAWRKFLHLLQEDGGPFADLSENLDSLARRGISPDQLEEAFRLMAGFPEVAEWPSGIEAAEKVDGKHCLEMIYSFLRMLRDMGDRLPENPGNDQFVPRLRNILREGSRLLELEAADALRDEAGLIRFLELFEGGDPERDRRIRSWTGPWGFSREEADRVLHGFLEARKTALSLLAAIRAQTYGEAVPVLLRALDFYARLKMERGLLGFQDLLFVGAKMLRENSEVRRALGERYRFILVDEFQDTDPLQAEILFLLASGDAKESDWRKCLPRPGSLFVVGDPKQSIYRFRRADIGIYSEVKKRFLDDPHGEVLVLKSNFRSLPCLVDQVNRCFSDGVSQEDKYFLPFGCGWDLSPQFQPMEPTRQEPRDEAKLLRGIYLLESSGNKEESVREEAEYIARFIRRALDGEFLLPSRAENHRGGGKPLPEDFMILTWRKEELADYAEALGRWGIPHTVSGGKPLRDNPAVRLLYLILKTILRPENPIPLVALLRSRLFGLSDRELFLYRQARGLFDFRLEPPPAEDRFDATLRSHFLSAFLRLRHYRRWVLSMPPTAALERIADDAGLFALAAAEDPEGLTSGGLAKALDLVRLAGGLPANPTDCLELLEAYVEGDLETDSIAAGSTAGRGVRVLNLHRAKGLEAPVVFLACPYGLGHGMQPSCHVERKSNGDTGYLLITAPSPRGNLGRRRHKTQTLACPFHWEEKAEEEERFLKAERTRLLYVAATRARDALIISRHAERKQYNPWQYLETMGGVDLRQAFPETSGEETVQEDVSPGMRKEPSQDPEVFFASLEKRKVDCARPTYRLIRGREAASFLRDAMEGEEPAEPEFPDTPPAGREALPRPGGLDAARWGEIVHLALQRYMERREEGPEQVAQEVAVRLCLEREVEQALATLLERTARSRLWRRALGARRVYCEVPFHYAEERGGEEIVVHGAMDLVFEEEGGWVIVDYKTDEPPAGKALGRRGAGERLRDYAEQLEAYSRAWERITGFRVVEKWLLFVSDGTEVKV